jgi:uncharacterized protein YeaO (DUF488 family)
MTFNHASIYDRDHVSARQPGGLRALVSRHWPRGVRKDRVDLWLKDAAPSRDLLNAYHDGLPWDQFERRYRDEILQERPDVLKQLRDLAREHGTVTLICYERMPPHDHCHRQILLDILNQPG